jgi:uncharacterized HAD superfamily protein
MRIGFDIDGIVVDLLKLIQETILDMYGRKFDLENLDKYGLEEITSLPYEKIRKAVDATTADIDGQLAHIFVDNVASLHEYYRDFLSKRPLVFITHRWDVENTEKVFSRLFSPGTYRIHYVNPKHLKSVPAKAESLDLFVDDRVDILEDMVKNGIQAVLFDYPHNRHDKKFRRIKTLGEII